MDRRVRAWSSLAFVGVLAATLTAEGASAVVAVLAVSQPFQVVGRPTR